VNRRDQTLLQKPDHPSVYCMSDRELAEEYGRLTCALVQVPSRHNPTAWWQWRSDLQERLKRERSSWRRRYVPS
jgi:hypothetical protein